ncbi:helix-turn-helix domain-containing protein [Nocardia amamiensis]|uniref:helix-turn-helix domain-containing protein n=1 Tax=Nocardia amamiensis TaxID=404578 RepID=UPI00083008F1|nr:helix-turn-helix transcriptional regulator [Nocardia amamiensis]
MATGSTLPRRILARRLTEMRERSKLSRTKAAAAVEMNGQTLWRLESGQNSQIKRMVINALCDLYGASADDRALMIWLAEESRKTGWWQSYSDAISADVELFVGLEQSARHITSFQLTLLPGLVQTHAYRRSIARTYQPPLSEDEIDRRMELLAKRQARLEEPPDKFALEVLLSEAALAHHVGGAVVMAEQLRYLAELAELPSVSIRIIPLDAGSHLGLQVGPFVLLEFPEHTNPVLTEPPVVYVEGYTGALYLDKADEIDQYRTARSAIRAVALDETESRKLLLKMAKEYGT